MVKKKKTKKAPNIRKISKKKRVKLITVGGPCSGDDEYHSSQ